MKFNAWRRDRGKRAYEDGRRDYARVISTSCFVAYPLRLEPPSQVTVSHKHEKALRAIFHDPISGNIHWREIESLLLHLGADIESLSGARMRVKLHGHEGILHRPHHGNTLGRQDIQHLRDYLAHARATPSQYEAGRQR